MPNSSAGANQSHYYQHLYSDTQNIQLDSSRKWTFATVENYIFANMGVYPSDVTGGDETAVNVDGSNVASAFCQFPSIIFSLIDPLTLKPWLNNASGPGLYGSDATCQASRLGNFEFDKLTRSRRKQVMDFMDSIPNNYIVVARFESGTDSANNTYAAEWASDTTAFGANNTMYQRLKSQGFVLIDSFYRPRAFIFMYQKNNPSFGPQFVFSDGIYDKVSLRKNQKTYDTIGYITSPKFGPATQWKEMHWRGTSLEPNSPDNPKVDIIGIDSLGNSTTLFK